MNLGIETEMIEFKMLKSGFLVCFYRLKEESVKSTDKMVKSTDKYV